MDELDALSALCLRSKAHWGYDAAFMDACREELSLTPEDADDWLIVAEMGGQAAGVAQVAPLDTGADLLLFFVDPSFIGQGVGRALFDWVLTRCRAMKADRLMIEADQGAAPIYEHMGARRVGEVASQSIPGRMLPLLQLDLR